MSSKPCTAQVLWWSKSGNTRKVADTIHKTLSENEIESKLLEIDSELSTDIFSTDLLFMGAPIWANLFPKPVENYLKKLLKECGPAWPAAPEKPGHVAIVFCTYGGSHTGTHEPVPSLHYMDQILEHTGMRVADHWAVLGGSSMDTVPGRVGNIAADRPDDRDLGDIEQKVIGHLKRFVHVIPSIPRKFVDTEPPKMPPKMPEF